MNIYYQMLKLLWILKLFNFYLVIIHGLQASTATGYIISFCIITKRYYLDYDMTSIQTPFVFSLERRTTNNQETYCTGVEWAERVTNLLRCLIMTGPTCDHECFKMDSELNWKPS